MRFAIALTCITALAGQTPSAEEQLAKTQQLYIAGDLVKAEKILLSLVPLATPTSTWAATAFSNLGVLCHEMGRITEAEHWHMKAKSHAAVDGPMYAQVLNSLASLYLETGRPGEAERIIGELEKRPLEGHLKARLNSNLGALYMVRGRRRDAEKVFLTVLDWWEKNGFVRDAAVVLNNLGLLAMERKDLPTALTRLQRSHDLWLQHAGAYHYSFLRTVANYGAVLLASGRIPEAERMLARARTLAEESHGAEHEITAGISIVYADALAATGRKQEAKRIRTDAMRVGSALRQTVDVLDFAAERKKKP